MRGPCGRRARTRLRVAVAEDASAPQLRAKRRRRPADKGTVGDARCHTFGRLARINECRRAGARPLYVVNAGVNARNSSGGEACAHGHAGTREAAEGNKSGGSLTFPAPRTADIRL